MIFRADLSPLLLSEFARRGLNSALLGSFLRQFPFRSDPLLFFPSLGMPLMNFRKLDPKSRPPFPFNNRGFQFFFLELRYGPHSFGMRRGSPFLFSFHIPAVSENRPTALRTRVSIFSHSSLDLNIFCHPRGLKRLVLGYCPQRLLKNSRL